MPSKPEKHDIPYSTYIRTINNAYGPEGNKKNSTDDIRYLLK